MFNDMSFNFYKMLWISHQTGRVGYCLILAVCLILFKIWSSCGFVLEGLGYPIPLHFLIMFPIQMSNCTNCIKLQ